MVWKIDWDTFLGERRTKHWLLAALVVGFGLRVLFLWSRSIWFDEAASVYIAQAGYWGILTKLAAVEFNPPLYFLLLRTWMLASAELWWIEILSALIGAVSVVVMYRWGKVLYGERVGLIAAGIMAIACLQIRYSQEIRMYSLAVLLVLLSNYYFAKVTREERFREGYSTWVKYVLVTALSLYAHYYAIFNVVVQNTYLFLRYRDRGLQKVWVVAQGAIAILFLPWVPSMMAQIMNVEEEYWIASPTLGKLAGTFVFLGDNAVAFAALLLLAIGGLLSFARLREGKVSVRSEKRNLFLAALVVLPVLLSFAVSLSTQSIFHERYFIIFAPALYLLAAKGYTHLSNHGVQWGCIAAISIGMGLCLVTFYQSANTDIASAAKFVERYHQPGTLVIHTQPSTFLPFRIYHAQPATEYLLSSKQLPIYLGGKYYTLDEYLTGTTDILETGAAHAVFVDTGEPNERVARAMQGIAVQESQGRFGYIWVTIYRITASVG